MKMALPILTLFYTISVFAVVPGTIVPPKANKPTRTSKILTKDTVSTKAAAPVMAQAFQNEILTNFTSAGIATSKPCKSCDSTTELGVNASYLYFLPGYLQDKLQVGAEGGIASVSAYGSTNTHINILAVGAYNLENDFKNSIFVKAGLGLFTVQGTLSSTETKFGLFLGAGKRFAWLSNVTFSPDARIVKKGDLDVGFEANILNFSIYWN